MTQREYRYIYSKKVKRIKKAIYRIFNNYEEIEYMAQLGIKRLQKIIKNQTYDTRATISRMPR